MKNKPNFVFFDNRGFPNWGGSAAGEFFPRNPVFLSDGHPYMKYKLVHDFCIFFGDVVIGSLKDKKKDIHC